MIKTFIRRTIDIYRIAAVFVLMAFSIILVPIAAEAVQHIAEVKFGMFNTEDGLQSGEKNLRLLAGVFKVLSVLLISLILPRYFIHDHHIGRALKFNAQARRVLYIAIFGIIIFGVLALYVGPLAIQYFVGKGVDIPIKLRPVLPLIILSIIILPLQFKTIGAIATVFGDTPMSKQEKSRLNKLMSVDFFLVLLTAIVPAMALHYVLNSFAMDKAGIVLFTVLAFDSILVGVLAALLAACTYVVYKEARQ